MPILNSKEIHQRAEEARKLSEACRLCPRACGVDRAAGERGYCDTGALPSVATVIPHFGEEPPLTTGGGAGTIFFTSCNIRCVYCQNHQISQGQMGTTLGSAELSAKILDLQQRGCSNIEPVSPTHHLPGFLEALALSVERGLALPVVYNTNAYESASTLDLLDGIVDIYLPDLKYAYDAHAARFSDVGDYVETARAAILKMHSQVGNLVVEMNGKAVKGMILRHLILPDGVSGTGDTLAWIAKNLPVSITISLMAQYSPLHRAAQFPPLDRRITLEEYDRIVDLAWDMGLENVFVQDFEAQDVGIPDFNEEVPFSWD